MASEVHTPKPPQVPLLSFHPKGHALGGREGVKKPIQGEIVCNLGDGVQLKLEPAFVDSEQGVHLIPRHEAGLVCPLMELCHCLTG